MRSLMSASMTLADASPLPGQLRVPRNSIDGFPLLRCSARTRPFETRRLGRTQRFCASIGRRPNGNDIQESRQTQFVDFSPTPGFYAASFRVRVLELFMEDGLMTRFVWLTCVALTLASLSGCHLCKKKHLRQATMIDGGSCDCGTPLPASFEGIPTAESGVMAAPAPAPYFGSPLPAPQKSTATPKS
jgi:hypothetical protein